MAYTKREILEYIEQENVKFIRLAFCDVFGVQKNIAITASELERAFEHGVEFDPSAITGFASAAKTNLRLFPDPATLTVLPWRPSTGRVIRFFCNIFHPDGKPFEADCRRILRLAADEAEQNGLKCSFGSKFEFYLFKTDESGNPTDEPHDYCGYLDVAPLDKGENIRREIVLTLEEMGMKPESSHHEDGPGQNEVDFRGADAPQAADNAVTFKNVVSTIAALNGLYADFSPKPMPDTNGNGFHINVSVSPREDERVRDAFAAGILEHICQITAFLNPTEESYKRLGRLKAPKYITWTAENWPQLMRIPSLDDAGSIELRSADCEANPYLAFALIIHAGIDGVKRGLELPAPTNRSINELQNAPAGTKTLPQSLQQAGRCASGSELVSRVIPECVLSAYVTGRR